MKDNSEAYNENQILEGNELIAEFIGFEKEKNQGDPPLYNASPYNTKWQYVHPIEMLFHRSWDWLMPVLDKITWHWRMSNQDFCVYKNDTDTMITEIHEPELSQIQCVWLGVVEYIKWHNKQKENPPKGLHCPKCLMNDMITLSDHQMLACSHSFDEAKDGDFFLENEVYATATCWRCHKEFEVCASFELQNR